MSPVYSDRDHQRILPDVGVEAYLPLDQAVDVFAVNVFVIRFELPLHAFRLFLHL